MLKTFELPDSLQEISGITYLENNKLAAVEDETSTIYVYDLISESVTEHIKFGEQGDYEDLAFVNESYYVLRSDGVLFEVKDRQTTQHTLDITAKNNEGLVYDPQTKSLLVSTKSKVEKGKEFKDKRYIYTFNTVTKKVSEEPLFVIDIEEIQHFIDQNNINVKGKNPKKLIKFRPSGIAVHPKTNNLHIVSAIDNIVVEINREGKILDVLQLDKNTFNQPEGIAFNQDGDVFISNEGGNGKPSLYLLSLK